MLITNRKSYRSFRFVQKSVTLNDFERRNGPFYFTAFGVASGAHCVSGWRCRRKKVHVRYPTSCWAFSCRWFIIRWLLRSICRYKFCMPSLVALPFSKITVSIFSKLVQAFWLMIYMHQHSKIVAIVYLRFRDKPRSLSEIKQYSPYWSFKKIFGRKNYLRLLSNVDYFSAVAARSECDRRRLTATVGQTIIGHSNLHAALCGQTAG